MIYSRIPEAIFRKESRARLRSCKTFFGTRTPAVYAAARWYRRPYELVPRSALLIALHQPNVNLDASLPIAAMIAVFCETLFPLRFFWPIRHLTYSTIPLWSSSRGPLDPGLAQPEKKDLPGGQIPSQRLLVDTWPLRNSSTQSQPSRENLLDLVRYLGSLGIGAHEICLFGFLGIVPTQAGRAISPTPQFGLCIPYL